MPASNKDYDLFMLFIKYVSDKYADYDGFEPPIVIPKGAGFRDMVALKGDADIGNKINTQLIQPLIEANTRLARSDFPHFDDPNKLGDGQKRNGPDVVFHSWHSVRCAVPFDRVKVDLLPPAEL